MILELLKQYTQLQTDDLLSLIEKAPVSYYKFSIDKKNGKGKRVIFQPSKSTKMLQYCLLNCFFSSCSINKMSTFGYQKGLSSPLKKNAMRHLNYEFTVHLDFAHFFPSVSSNMLFRSLQIQNIELDDYDQSIIQKICFRNTNMSYYLSIGSPTSPIISNIIMKEFDDYFMGYAARYSSSYTRYADDLWFSTNSYKQRNDFCNDVTDYLKRNDWLLQINQQKTYFSRKNQAHHIAGLVITEKQEIKVPRKIKRYIRSLLFDKDFDFDKKQILNGYISYIRDNEPSYLNNLIKKYGKVYYKKIIQEN